MSAPPTTMGEDAPVSPLLATHEAAGASLTTFAGWRMPLRYGSELGEHHAVRASGGLFDLSHMARIEISGPGSGACVDRSVVSRVGDMEVGRARYTLVPSESGGVLDDVIVYRIGVDDWLIVANAANRGPVLDAVTRRSVNGTAVVDRTSARALLAVQGPRAAEVLQHLVTEDLSAVRYYRCAVSTVHGVPALIARTGYTGEDGFEIDVPALSATRVWEALRAAGEPLGVLPCGLAARDTLRLEAGMPLYGHELSTDTSPWEVGFGRLVHLESERDLWHREALEARRAEAPRTLIHLRGDGRRAARSGYPLLDVDGARVGIITSGALSPTLGHPIAMAMLDPGVELAVGSRVDVDLRGTRTSMVRIEGPSYRRPR